MPGQKISGPANPPPAPPPQTEARLIARNDDAKKLGKTVRRDCDAGMALRRGLAQYLRDRKIIVGGREYAFKAVHEDWADAADNADYPAAGLNAITEVTYDAHAFVPSKAQEPLVPASPSSTMPRYLVRQTDAVQEVGIVFRAATTTEREILAALLEEALSPVEWMFGFRLYLPFYFGAIASYEPIRNGETDSEDTAMRRVREQQFVVKGVIPVYRLGRFAEAQPSQQTTVTSSQDPAEEES